jgi:hypothetical protein
MASMVFLHCGLHKTGTTAIQAALLASRDKLLAHGILYPVNGGNESGHPNLAWEILGDGRFDSDGLTLDRAVQQIVAFPGKIVLSSEEFESMLDVPSSLTPLVERLRGAGGEVCLVIYTRNETAYAESLYIELLKHGYDKSFGDAIREIRASGYLRFRAWRFQFDYPRLAAGLAASPDLKIIWRAYDDVILSGSVVTDFLSVIGADPQLLAEAAFDRLNVRNSVHESLLHFCRNALHRELRDIEFSAIGRLCNLLGSKRLAAGPSVQMGHGAPGNAAATAHLERVFSRATVFAMLALARCHAVAPRIATRLEARLAAWWRA